MQSQLYAPKKPNKHTPKTRTVLLVDQDPLTREALSDSLRSAGAIEIVAIAEAQLLDNPSTTAKLVDLVILNMGQRRIGDAEVHAAIDILRQRFSEAPLAVFVDRVHVDDIQMALRLGVRGYIPTYLSPQEVLTGLRIVLASGIFVPAASSDTASAPQGLVQARTQPAPQDSTPQQDACLGLPLHLTLREVEVLRFIRECRTNREIARELNMAESTVKVHIRHIMRELKATNRMHAVQIADRDVPPLSPPLSSATDERAG